MANGDQDWRYWALRIAYGIVALLVPITIGLAAYSYTSLKTDLSKDISRIESTFTKHLEFEQVLANKQDARFDQLCQKVGEHSAVLREHDTLLRLPWIQRKDFYQYPKFSPNNDNRKTIP
jgi:hypothetical protein